jgi:hypothetical protein
MKKPFLCGVLRRGAPRAMDASGGALVAAAEQDLHRSGECQKLRLVITTVTAIRLPLRSLARSVPGERRGGDGL